MRHTLSDPVVRRMAGSEEFDKIARIDPPAVLVVPLVSGTSLTTSRSSSYTEAILAASIFEQIYRPDATLAPPAGGAERLPG